MTNRGRTFTLAGALATGGALATALLTTGPAPPQVSVADVNPGTSVERDLCLSVSLAPGAASECGDLRLAHALPAVRTLGRARAVGYSDPYGLSADTTRVGVRPLENPVLHLVGKRAATRVDPLKAVRGSW
jgi:hypothetical protein